MSDGNVTPLSAGAAWRDIEAHNLPSHFALDDVLTTLEAGGLEVRIQVRPKQ